MKKAITSMHFTKRVVLSITLFCCTNIGLSQNNSKPFSKYLDSANYFIKTGQKDSSTFYLHQAGNYLSPVQVGEMQIAYIKYCMAFEQPNNNLLNTLGYDASSNYHSHQPELSFKTNLDNSIYAQLMTTIDWAKQNHDERILAESYLLLTDHFQKHLRFNQSIKWNYKAIVLFEKHQLTVKQAIAGNLLANSFLLTGKTQEGIRTMKDAAQLYLQQEDLNSRAQGYYLLAKRATYINGDEYSDSAEFYFNKAIDNITVTEFHKGNSLLYGIYTNKGVNLSRNNQQEKSLKCFKTALHHSSFVNQEKSYNLSYNIGAIYAQMGQLDSAIKYIEITIKNLEGTKDLKNASDVLWGIAFFYEQLEDYPNALKHYKVRTNLLDSLYRNMHQDSLLAYQLQFEYDKKEAVLQAEKKAEAAQFNLKVKHQDYQFKSLLIGAISILIVVILGFVFWHRLKKKIKEEKQKEDYLKLVVSAQRAERKKIAHLLHDNCGASLAAVKLSLNSLFNKQLSKEMQEKKSERVFTIIDSVAKDIRDLSHDLLPYEAGNLNIEMSLQTLFDNLLTSAGIQFSLSSNLKDIKLPEQYEYGIYQIVTELTNNVLKHSSATKVEIALNKQHKQLTLTYTENGTGKPKDITEGIGQKLIKTQLIALNGTMKYTLEKRKLCCTVVLLLND